MKTDELRLRVQQIYPLLMDVAEAAQSGVLGDEPKPEGAYEAARETATYNTERILALLQHEEPRRCQWEPGQSAVCLDPKCATHAGLGVQKTADLTLSIGDGEIKVGEVRYVAHEQPEPIGHLFFPSDGGEPTYYHGKCCPETQAGWTVKPVGVVPWPESDGEDETPLNG